jgi:hypothetical protein
VNGYVPIYGDKSQSEISFKSSPKILADPGKIYIYKNYLLVNEKNKGIHVYDNSIPASPIDLGFIEMLGNSDMAIKDDILYADHIGDLVSLSISSLDNLKLTNRIKLSSWALGVPAPRSSYFECVNADAGYVVGWNKKLLTNPDCYAY